MKIHQKLKAQKNKDELLKEFLVAIDNFIVYQT